MNKLALIAATALTAGLSVSAQAQLSSPAEARGYDACLSAAETDYQGLVTKRDYFIAKQDASNVYYINATAWEGSDRVPVRVFCETSPNGRKLVNYSATAGRYALSEQGVGEVLAVSE
ncbi:MAG: hypothetical protein V2I63_00410 [Pseudomonadales bacterium]|jgi:hypothetical protein|nr:hypothetical protein [Pseudomonadales bacterium]